VKIKSWLLLLFIILGLSLVIFKFFPQLILPRMVDFEVNYQAGQRIWRGETLYRVEDGHYQFKYPPFASLLYFPLGFLSLNQAKFIWFMLTVTATFALIILSSRLAAFPSSAPAYVPVFTFLILARFLARELSLGQINTLIICLLLLMLKNWLIDSGSFATSLKTGFLWGLATSLKPYALIFFPLFLLRRRWKIIGSALFFFILSFFMPAIFYGLKGNLIVHQEWLNHLKASTPPLLSSQDNISLFALLYKWFGPEIPVWTLGLFAIALLAAAIFLAVIRAKNMNYPVILEAAALLLLMPIVSPLGWDYTLLSSSLAISLILYHFPTFPRLSRYFLGLIFILIAFMIFDLLGRQVYSFLMMKISLPTLLFLLVLGYLLWLRFKGKA